MRAVIELRASNCDLIYLQKKPYSFTYGVRDARSGADFEQNEERSGHVTRGSYKVGGRA